MANDGCQRLLRLSLDAKMGYGQRYVHVSVAYACVHAYVRVCKQLCVRVCVLADLN